MMKLIPDWTKAWKFASVQWSALGIFLMGTADLANQIIAQLPEPIQSSMPHATTIAMVVFVMGMVGRMLTFGGTPNGPEANG